MSSVHSAPLTRDALLAAFSSYGRPRQRWLVGAEFERHVLSPVGHPAPYHGAHGIRRLVDAFGREGWKVKREGPWPVEAWKGRASLTLEPGSQVELSGAPHATLAAVRAEAEAFTHLVDALIDGTDHRQVALGFTPFAPISRVPFIPKGRYAIMRAHMARSGALGHHMMKGTAATQASFDFSDEADAACKVRLATVLAPIVTALFANSPLAEGRPTGFQSWRGFIWTHTDPARTGMPEAASAFTFERWVDYLLDTPMMFVKRDGAWLPAEGRTFGDWLDGRAPWAAPTWSDWDLHLTSVFPEVRTKRQIEVRMADCVPLPLAMAFIGLFTGLFYCPVALDRARGIARRFERFGSREERFLCGARHGLQGVIGGHRLADWAAELLDAAHAGLSACAPGEETMLRPAIALADRGETLASRLLAALGDRITPERVAALTHPLSDALLP